MDINLSVVILGHAVELHLCLGGGKVVEKEDGIEVVELQSDTELEPFLTGFQPNPETEEDN